MEEMKKGLVAEQKKVCVCNLKRFSYHVFIRNCSKGGQKGAKVVFCLCIILSVK